MKHICIILLLLIAVNAFSQSYEEIRRNTQTYLWGEGTGSTISRADQEALSELIGQISIFVESITEGIATQQQQGTVFHFEESFKASVTTYSTATLRNTERIVLSDEPNARVFCYVKRSEVGKIFEERKSKITEFVRYGQQACR